MKMFTFAKRCAKEILRDPINLGFGLGFPLVLLILLSAIQANIPVSLFEINTLTPGITVFGMSFITLFSAPQRCGRAGTAGYPGRPCLAGRCRSDARSVRDRHSSNRHWT